MDADLFQQIKTELRNRSVWEEKQSIWYRMRYEGIKRAKKPYPNAPDMHYALVDTMIEKIKPFYVAFLYGQERLAGFISEAPQDDNLTTLAEKLFDNTLKQHTNFERAIYTSLDYKLMYGRGPVKTIWDTDKKKIQFSAVRPIHIIVPSWTEELGSADWLVHILHLSKDQYLRNKKFNQDPVFVKSITGRPTEGSGSGAITSQEQNILRREGITIGQTDSQIVIWETYTRDGDKILVDTISPMAGIDEPVCQEYGMPYKHGQFPFSDMRYELADADYYSTRGLAEILAHNELDLCKLWNHKLQFLDFHGQPNFKNSGSAVNPTAFNNAPGRILPVGIEPVDPASTPLEFKDEMQLQRALAEDRVQVPDLSAGEHLTGNRGSDGKVTATQITAIQNQSSGGNDMRSRVFKLQLAVLYNQAWSLRCQFVTGKGDQALADFTQVPVEALHDQYRITPSGSADSYSKEQRMQKAMAYYQTFNQNPFVKQDELTKWTFEQDDSALVQRLFQEPQDAQMDQAEHQAEEIGVMLDGFPAKVNKGDDDKTHVITVAQWVEAQQQQGKPITPEMAGLTLQHVSGHAQQIQQKKDKQGMMLLKNIAPVGAYLQSIVQQGQQAMQPPQGAPGAPQGSPQGQPPSPQQEDKPSATANALAALMKAGANISHDDVNAALVKLGLPPVALPPPGTPQIPLVPPQAPPSAPVPA